MPDELKAKLREIVAQGIENYSKSAWQTVLETSGDKVDETIAQIDQAYKDAGYAKPSDEVVRDVLDKVIYGTVDEIVKGYTEAFKTMTGRQFYERFVKEWDSRCMSIGTIPVTDELPFMYGRIANESAKRAAGL